MHQSPDRHYRRRDDVRPGEQKFQVVVEETDLWITVSAAFDAGAARDIAAKTALALRKDILFWCGRNPAFRHSLTPLPAPEHAPDIVRRMAQGAALMGVGPFAAVAGAIAERVANALAEALRRAALPPDVIVENGGDTYLHSTGPRVVALLPKPEEGESVGLLFRPEDFPLSLCSSSGRIGHSLSFGRGDLAMVRARDGALADAAATAYGNMLCDAQSVNKALKRAEKDAALGIEGVFFQCAGAIGIWGKLELAALA